MGSNLPNWLQGEEPLPPESPKRPPKKSGFNPLALAGGLLFIFVAIAVLGAIVRAMSPAPATPSESAVIPADTSPVATFAIVTWTVDPSIPTATPVPTSTPTLTPEPTPTPIPTATVNPDADAEEAYRLFAIEMMEAYSEGFVRFSEQNKAASENPLLILNQDWILRTALSTVLIEEASTRILERENVPPKYQAFHSQFVQVAKLNEQSMRLYRQSVDSRDANGLQESVRLVEEAGAILEQMDVNSLQP